MTSPLSASPDALLQMAKDLFSSNAASADCTRPGTRECLEEQGDLDDEFLED